MAEVIKDTEIGKYSNIQSNTCISEVLLSDGERIAIRKSNQTVSPLSGRISISKKGWILRAITITSLTSLIFLYCYYGIVNPKEQVIMLYSSFILTLAIIVFIFGWIFYRNPTHLSTTISNQSSSLNNAESATPDNEKLVSIIIPIYNQKKLVETVIDSIFNSTYRNIEVVAVNDGSTDGTDKILDYLKSQKYRQLKVVNKVNEGKRKAVASGFVQSQGQYIILIDSDSIIENNAIAEFVKVFESDSSIGSAAGHAKVWNSDKNFLTKCQDSWYDYEYNIFKAYESYFGTVTCCSGCLAGYRRDAIENSISIWNKEVSFNFNDKNETSSGNTVNIENKLHKNKIMIQLSNYFTLLCNKLMINLLNYDDSEDRALTTCSIRKWKSVYISTAFVYTEVPDKLKSYVKQQQRWKKGYLRANLFASTFILSKKNPVISLLFYTGFIMAIISPIITPVVLLYNIFVLDEIMAPLSLVGGFLAIGFLEGIDYKMRDPDSKNWMYKPLMNLILTFMISWLIYAAIINYRKNVWLTR